VQYVPVGFGLVLLLAGHLPLRRRLQLTAIFVIALTVTLAPWIIRNYHTFGRVFLSHTYQDNIARVSAVAILAEVQGEDIRPWSERWEELYGTLVTRAAVEYQWPGTSEPTCPERQQQHADVARVAVEVIGEHPVAFVIAHVRPVLHSLLPQEQFYWYQQLTGEEGKSTAPPDASRIERLLHRPPLLLVMWAVWLAGYALIYIGVIIGLWVLHRSPGMVVALLVLLLTGFALPGPLADVRFRVPVVPYVVLLYTTGLLHLATKWPFRR
jgi:hypothetical protein